MQCYVIPDSYRLDGRTGKAVDSVPFHPEDAVRLCGARNEYLSFQIVCEGMTGSLESTEFAFRAIDESFAALRFSVYYEWFHACEGKLIPDMLIPWDMKDQLDISGMAARYYESAYRVFWVDCFIPKGTDIGMIKGTVDVVCEGETHVIPVQIQVMKPELCDEALIHADFNNYSDNLSALFPGLKENDARFTDGSYTAMERPFYRTAHEHRAFFHLLPYSHSGFVYESFAPVTEGQGTHLRVTDWTQFDRHYGPYFDGSAFAGTERGPIPVPFAYLPFCFDWPASYEKFENPGYRVENRRMLLEFIRHFEEKGWTKTVFELFCNHKKRYRFYPYDGDELRHSHDEELTYRFRDIFCDLFDHSDVQVLLRTDASWSFGHHYNTELTKIIKMWCVGSSLLQFYKDSYQYMKEQGNILFSYGGIPYMDSDLTALLEWPMRCLQNDFTGFLYWNTTGIGKDFLSCPHNKGCETFFYPAYPFGGTAGIFPSLRLKFLRNAMQIADLVKMYEGTWTFHEMRAEINRLYGIEADQWYSPLPELLDIPPHEVTNDLIHRACEGANRPSRYATPALPRKIKERMLEMAAAFVGGQSVWR